MENKEVNTQDNQKAKKRGKIILLVLLVLLIVITFFQCSHNLSSKKGTGITEGIIDIGNSDIAQELVNQRVEAGMFQVFMNNNIKVDKEGNADVLIQNSKSNHYDCYVELHNNSGEMVYKSDIIQPGYKLEQDKIEIQSGEYDCNAYFKVLDTNGNEINKVGLLVKIIKE